jgi:hypothetical protein
MRKGFAAIGWAFEHQQPTNVFGAGFCFRDKKTKVKQ